MLRNGKMLRIVKKRTYYTQRNANVTATFINVTSTFVKMLKQHSLTTIDGCPSIPTLCCRNILIMLPLHL